MFRKELKRRAESYRKDYKVKFSELKRERLTKLGRTGLLKLNLFPHNDYPLRYQSNCNKSRKG